MCTGNGAYIHVHIHIEEHAILGDCMRTYVYLEHVSHHKTSWNGDVQEGQGNDPASQPKAGEGAEYARWLQQSASEPMIYTDGSTQHVHHCEVSVDMLIACSHIVK